MSEQTLQPIVFYDGECGLCNQFVQFVLNHDTKGRIRLAPLQGETFNDYRCLVGEPDLSTVVFVKDGRAYVRSEAALRVLKLLRWPWPWIGHVGWFVPRVLRDWAYSQVASRRYRWFGQAHSCRLATPFERARLLP